MSVNSPNHNGGFAWTAYEHDGDRGQLDAVAFSSKSPCSNQQHAGHSPRRRFGAALATLATLATLEITDHNYCRRLSL